MHSETVASSADEAAVRDVYRQLMDAWNRGSGPAWAEGFTEDGHLVAFDGSHLQGRHEIAPFHQELFDKWLKGSRLVGKVDDVLFLAPDVAVMHATGGTVMRGKSEPSPARDSIQTLVVTRQEGEWSVAGFHNTRIRPIVGNLRAFVAWTLSDWLWTVLRLNRKRIS